MVTQGYTCGYRYILGCIRLHTLLHKGIQYVVTQGYTCSYTRVHTRVHTRLHLVTQDYISEGSVSHINGVRPGFLELQLVSR